MPDRIKLLLTNISFGSANTNFYTFALRDGAALPPCEPGAHISLHLPNGMERQYSLLEADPHPNAYVVGIKLESQSRGGSAWIHENLRVGMEIEIDPPRNHFPLVKDAPYSVLIAGGIGITPLYCMARKLRAIGRPFELHYTSRMRCDAILLREMADWPNVAIRFGEESGGVPFALAEVVARAPAHAHLYCCGPVAMLTAFEAAGMATGRSTEEIHIEYFEPKFAAATAGGFSVVLARSDREILVPAGKSILDVLLEHGIYVSHSCSEGVCGACETTVIEGVPDHRDAILSEDERAANLTMMVCCSGSKSERLVLDI